MGKEQKNSAEIRTTPNEEEEVYDGVEQRQSADIDPSSGVMDSPNSSEKTDIIVDITESPQMILPDVSNYQFSTSEEYAGVWKYEAELSSTELNANLGDRIIDAHSWDFGTPVGLTQILTDCRDLQLPVEDQLFQETFARLQLPFDVADPETMALLSDPLANKDVLLSQDRGFDVNAYLEAYDFITTIKVAVISRNASVYAEAAQAEGQLGDVTSTGDEGPKNKYEKAADDLRAKLEKEGMENSPMGQFMLMLFEFLGEYWEVFEDFDEVVKDAKDEFSDETTEGTEVVPGDDFNTLYKKVDLNEQYGEAADTFPAAHLIANYNLNGFRLNLNPDEFKDTNALTTALDSNYYSYYKKSLDPNQFGGLKNSPADIEGAIIIFKDAQGYEIPGEIKNGQILCLNPTNNKPVSAIEVGEFVAIYQPSELLRTKTVGDQPTGVAQDSEEVMADQNTQNNEKDAYEEMIIDTTLEPLLSAMGMDMEEYLASGRSKTELLSNIKTDGFESFDEKYQKVDFETWKAGVKSGEMDGSIAIFGKQEGENFSFNSAVVIDSYLFVASFEKTGETTSETFDKYPLSQEPIPVEGAQSMIILKPTPQQLEEIKKNRKNSPHAHLYQ